MPKVSIFCMVYNHEPFIRQCLEGFLMQECNFDYEIVLGEDCSTDGSRAIIKEYAERYPDKFKLLLHDNNIGAAQNQRIVFENCTGKYIAMCEGDDYWTDPLKLQKQVDFLEANEDYIMVTNNAILLNENNNSQILFSDKPSHNIELMDLLGKRPFTTASVLFRNSIQESIKADCMLFDTALWCMLKMEGNIMYINDVTSVYRRGLHGIVESTDKLEWALTMEKLNIEIKKIVKTRIDSRIFRQRNYSHFRPLINKYLREFEFKKLKIVFYKSIYYLDYRIDNKIINFIKKSYE